MKIDANGALMVNSTERMDQPLNGVMAAKNGGFMVGFIAHNRGLRVQQTLWTFDSGQKTCSGQTCGSVFMNLHITPHQNKLYPWLRLIPSTPEQFLDFLYQHSPSMPVKSASRLHAYISDKLEAGDTTAVQALLQKIDLEQLDISLATAFLFFTRGFEPTLEPDYSAYKKRLTSHLINIEGPELARIRLEAACRPPIQ
jgi:hypothetical protein